MCETTSAELGAPLYASPPLPPLPSVVPARRALLLSNSRLDALPVRPGPKSKALPGARPTGAAKLTGAPLGAVRANLLIADKCPAGDVPKGDPLRSDALPMLSAPRLGKLELGRA